MLPSARAYAGIGSRETPEEACASIAVIGAVLRSLELECWTGGAIGADDEFRRAAGPYVRLFLPWPGFEGHTACRLARPTERAVEIAAALHPKWGSLSRKGRLLIARDTHQVLGPTCNERALFVVCWTPDGAERGEETSENTGGTGQAIRVASAYDVPVFNLARRPMREILASVIDLSSHR